MVKLGTLNQETVEFLQRCIKAQLNMLISGGTGSGKTTLLGVLSSFIPEAERLITIEDVAELRLRQPHVVSLEARPPNVDGVGAVTVRALVRNALRMRPDRIIVGEVRGGEAIDMLQAMNTGHEGSMSTAHANTSLDLLSRLETMALMSDLDLPVSHVREQIASALDLIVHTARLPDGRRAVVAVTAVEGMRAGAIATSGVYERARGRSPGHHTVTAPVRGGRVAAVIPEPTTDPGKAARATAGRPRRRWAPWAGRPRRLGSILE
jgi:pilus assembly protein CpaF